MRRSPAYRSKTLRDSARGRCCTLICSGNPETTVLCHLPSNIHGMGYKSDDYWAVFGCSGCHDVIDGRKPYDWRPGELEETYLHALHQTLRIWFDMEMLYLNRDNR
ncbi:DUF1364 family protein [Serratia marcescens]|uniref:nuclease domain-containing protein n=1 Tax=Serratia marcescens TaxID=615 RepID=UPI003204C7EE